MDRGLRPVRLESLQRGAVIDMFDEELEKVVRNIDDMNTTPNATREIVIRLKIKPDKTRTSAETHLSVTSKLASIKPAESFMFFDRENGKPIAYEDEPAQLLPFSAPEAANGN